ncbi:MAG TPA: GTPase ObgE [Candidatus Ornithomonoglobus merdipullorum]|uniref:GTPase Obg n=1 Tax=Candidatus Ornithomonoglobus merdipullorum TaxID=2840895 RepID=A0A9D1SF46_9FIRM|nr:GTPase ObgE [Candidatus Ornithomonoglobus merdipullorum]
MFTDKAKIFIKAGNGGNGAISWRREKYVPAGGPDGGDGGNGGDVIFRVDTGMTTLMDFRYKRKYAAGTGMDGAGQRKKGKDGEDIIIRVPQGTLVRDAESNLIIADLSDPEKDEIIAKGGSGGWGNSHFATAVRQAPNFAKNGQKGEEREVILELKLLADVGLVGFPNVGKSTLLSMTTKAQPKIANYHFTTLEPNLGVVDLGDSRSFVMADIPGIIEGASEGIGLGHEFLRHIERTRLLIHVVDVSGIEGRDPIEDLDIINSELAAYDMALEERPQIIAANKSDIIQDEAAYEAFIEETKRRGLEVITISAATGKNVDVLMKRAYEELSKLPPIVTFEPQVDLEAERFVDKSGKGYEIHRENDVFVITGSWIEAVGNSVTFDDNESLGYFQRALINRGVIEELISMGIKEGQLVRIGDLEFEFLF